MKKENGQIIYSPSDLVTFIKSPFASWCARYNLEFPGKLPQDDEKEDEILIRQLGERHEKEYLGVLQKQNRNVCEIRGDSFKAVTDTLKAMKEGREVIYQARLRSEQNVHIFEGWADFLERVEGRSRLGKHYYEVWDTKLAKAVKPYFLVQICSYAEMLEAVQGMLPPQIGIITGPMERQSFRTEDFLYFYRQVKNVFIEFQNAFDPEKPPEPEKDNGRWETYANELLEKQDHLIRTANIRRKQILNLHKAGITTVEGLARSTVKEVNGIGSKAFQRLKDQAILQVASLGRELPEYKLLPVDPENPRRGLALLPPASRNDIFFDIEGYPFWTNSGLEYLFGAFFKDGDKCMFLTWWAHYEEQEKEAFENFVRWAYRRWLKDKGMHIYHYNVYEVSALRRLMGKYGTCEDEVDNLLRNNVFVDLYTILRQSVLVSEPSYSLKNIERLYRSERQTFVQTAMDSIVYYHRYLTAKDLNETEAKGILLEISEYNKDDCQSTYELSEWLRNLQKEHGIEYVPDSNEQEEKREFDLSSHPEIVEAQRLLDEIPEAYPADSERWRIQELLAWMLQYHRREDKPMWWSLFERLEMENDDLFEIPGCLAGLKLRHYEGFNRLAQYSFDPEQETKLNAGDRCWYLDHNGTHRNAQIISLDDLKGSIVLQIGRNYSPPDQTALILNEYVNPKVIVESITDTATTWRTTGKLPPALDNFLRRERPKIKANRTGPILAQEKDVLGGIIKVVKGLNESSLYIQGPPGSGKTLTSAKFILVLIRDGKRVGVTSNSHAAINLLMRMIGVLAREEGFPLRSLKLGGEKDNSLQDLGIDWEKSNSKISKAIDRDTRLIGGTAWAFSRPEARNLIDYLVVDESGQVSLANLVGMSPCTKNIILVGDQMQLSQPVRGSHPGDSGKSILDYYLRDRSTIPPDQGIFLETTYRLHPDLCDFISKTIYEGRLKADSGNENRVIKVPKQGAKKVKKEAGVLYIPVDHEGNVQGSDEEIEVVKELVAELIGRIITDKTGNEVHKLRLEDILFVAPFNLQVNMLTRSLPPGARVGTIDKFQGQEAPVVIISMVSSDLEIAPRGCEFLLSLNRLNVALSRAQCLAIVVGSPKLAQARASSVEQMRLINLYCKIVQ